jgi:hypothetical protein
MIHQRRWRRRGHVHVQLSFLEEKGDDESVAVSDLRISAAIACATRADGWS